LLTPTEGKLWVDGLDTSVPENLLEVRGRVGMVFQNPDNQIVATVVEEDVAFGPENLGFPPEEIRARVDSALKAVGMYKHRGKEPHKLSGGQKQRVAIAGILAMKPECILFDESTAMLDPKGRRSIMRIIRKMHDEMAKTVVYITHYMEEAAAADRVIVMEGGKVIDDGTPYEVFSNIGKIRSVGLDVPQSTELADLLREDGMDLPGDILTTEECIAALTKTLKR
ncbi:MAG: energy-coupling factor transporter ATPase, partial [Clostridia bacterium]|nr:energy-coupling factor transporter ATPase [Clostridia bacterium]